MKTSSSSLIHLCALAVSPVAAFPQNLAAIVARQAVAPQGAGFLPAVPPPFSAAQQHVSTSGQYAFVAPSASDARGGMCPVLLRYAVLRARLQ